MGKGELLFTELDCPQYYKYQFEIEAGFHSLQTRAKARVFKISHHYTADCSVHKFIIPKGSKFYRNENEYISDHLIFVK